MSAEEKIAEMLSELTVLRKYNDGNFVSTKIAQLEAHVTAAQKEAESEKKISPADEERRVLQTRIRQQRKELKKLNAAIRAYAHLWLERRFVDVSKLQQTNEEQAARLAELERLLQEDPELEFSRFMRTAAQVFEVDGLGDMARICEDQCNSGTKPYKVLRSVAKIPAYLVVAGDMLEVNGSTRKVLRVKRNRDQIQILVFGGYDGVTELPVTSTTLVRRLQDTSGKGGIS